MNQPPDDPLDWDIAIADVLTFVGLLILALLFWIFMAALGSWTGGHL